LNIVFLTVVVPNHNTGTVKISCKNVRLKFGTTITNHNTFHSDVKNKLNLDVSC